MAEETHDQDKHDPEDAELAQDLEIKDAEDADAVVGGGAIKTSPEDDSFKGP
jgi:hypothetical protein